MDRLVIFFFFISVYFTSIDSYSTLHQSCSLYSGRSDSCDPYSYLYCDSLYQTCLCKEPETIWIPSYKRCMIKIGYSCKEENGDAWEQEQHNCPPKAYCNPATKRCACEALYKADYYLDRCIPAGIGAFATGHRIQMTSSIGLLIIFSSTLYIFI